MSNEGAARPHGGFELLDHIPIGVFILDGGYKIVCWNRQMMEWTGTPPADVVGEDIRVLYPHLNSPMYRLRIEEVIEGGLPTIFSAQLHKGAVIPMNDEAGQPRAQHVTVRPIPAPGGGRWALFAVQDVTDLVGRIRDVRAMHTRALKEIEERKKAESALRVEKEKAEKLAERLRYLSHRDGLTGVANRRYFDETLEREWRRSQREDDPISMILFDLDSFKAYNDNYGHLEGDECLRKVGAAAGGQLMRPTDFLARYGGEEFAVVLPGSDEEGAVTVAERLRAAVQELAIPHFFSLTGLDVATISVGVATARPKADDGSQPGSLIGAADAALYEAKRQGRNRVVAAKSHPTAP